jgi:hypothetical protein
MGVGIIRDLNGKHLVVVYSTGGSQNTDEKFFFFARDLCLSWRKCMRGRYRKIKEEEKAEHMKAEDISRRI